MICIFIKIFLWTSQETLNTEEAEAATEKVLTRLKLPKKEDKNLASEWKKMSTLIPRNTWLLSALCAISKFLSKFSIFSMMITMVCLLPWIFVKQSEISEDTNPADHSSMLPCQCSMLTMEVKLHSNSSWNWWLTVPVSQTPKMTSSVSSKILTKKEKDTFLSKICLQQLKSYRKKLLLLS